MYQLMLYLGRFQARRCIARSTSWKPGGIVVSITEDPAEMAQKLGIRGLRVTVRPHKAQLIKIAKLVEDGALRPTIAGTFPLANVQNAYQELQAGHVRGKLVLEMGG